MPTNKGKLEGNRTLGALQFRQGSFKGNTMQSQRQGKRYNLVATSAKRLAEEDTKVALNKATKKKLERDGSYTERLKDGTFVEINPIKMDLASGPGNNQTQN